MPRPLATIAIAATAAFLLSAAGLTSGVAAASSAAPVEPGWVVSLGDSYISGEAGRWAGNQTLGTSSMDALGPSAYLDGGDKEVIPYCHRSASAPIHIKDAPSLNLACSGALTHTRFNTSGHFKPGIDFYQDRSFKGQALMLQEFATGRPIDLVAVSIGGNEYSFDKIATTCVALYLVPFVKPHCSDDKTVNRYLNSDAVKAITPRVSGALNNIVTAMTNAGHANGSWTLAVQLYPEPIARSGEVRFAEAGYARQTLGGCGFRNRDLDWANDSFLATVNKTVKAAVAEVQGTHPDLNIVVIDAIDAFDGRTLCHKDTKRVRETSWFRAVGPSSWRTPGASDRTEWVRAITMTEGNETYVQEGLHPNYWGQLALRNCLRQAWNYGDSRGGTCSRTGTGLNSYGEPNMTLQ